MDDDDEPRQHNTSNYAWSPSQSSSAGPMDKLQGRGHKSEAAARKWTPKVEDLGQRNRRVGGRSSDRFDLQRLTGPSVVRVDKWTMENTILPTSLLMWLLWFYGPLRLDPFVVKRTKRDTQSLSSFHDPSFLSLLLRLGWWWWWSSSTYIVSVPSVLDSVWESSKYRFFSHSRNFGVGHPTNVLG